jgi:serine/threonine protein kinase
MSAGEPPPSDPEAFAPTIAPSTAQRPPVVTAPFGRTTTKDVGARDVGQASYQDTVAIGSGAPTGEAAAIDDLPLTDPALYVSEREVARGGMGRIIGSRSRRSCARRRPARAVRREAMVTANLQHPAIVPVYEVGRWPSGEPFYAMKLVRGRALDALIAEATTTEARLALLPHAIAIAESRSPTPTASASIHRDLKPANVLVGDFGETVVIDWGLAQGPRRQRDTCVGARLAGAAQRPSSADPAP